MNPSRPFILRPVATVLLMAAILLVGIVAYKQLPVSALPQVDYPTIQVITFYPGASPDVVTSSITAPLERQFGQVPGLTQMTSSSSDGCSVITLRFALELDIDVAEQQVQASINAASNFLPRDLPNPPVYSKTNPADAPILTLALSSDSMPLTKVQDLADTRLAQKISQLSGVGMVSLSGGQKPAIRIQANPTALSALGLNLEDLRIALTQASVNTAKGNFDGSQLSYTIGANDQLLTSDQYRQLTIAYRNGAPVKLVDVADVVDDAENIRQAAWMNDTPAVILNIQRQPGANIIEVVDRVKELLPRLKASLPASVSVSVLTDRTLTIRASVEDVQWEMMMTIGLVVAVMFVFLRNIPATIIPSVAVPLSLIGTFGVMYLLDYSLNNLTLMALTISTGFVVDDAIVMIENIVRYIEQGDSPLQAALKGSGEIGFTIVSLSVSLIAVLIPLLFMGDIVGRLFREFAVTLSVTILLSAIVSLTLTPMMCAKLLKHTAPNQHGWLYRISEYGFNSVIRMYGMTLRVVLRFQLLTLLVAIATLVATVYLYMYVPKGFFPVQDTGVILGISEAPQSISFAAMSQRQQALNRAILEDEAVDSLSSFIGIDGTNTTMNSGRIQINLKPLEERKLSASEVIRRLQPRIEKVQGITLFMQPVQDLTVETRVSRTQYQYSLEDPDAKELGYWSKKFLAKLQTLPLLRDVASDQQDDGLQAKVVIDRDSASRLGVTPQMIDDALYDAFGQRQISILFTQLNQYRVVLEAKNSFRDKPDALGNIYIHTPNGGKAPLSAFTRIEHTTAPLAVNHQGQFPVVTISFNLAPGASLGDAVEAIAEARQELDLPPSIRAGFQGTAEAFQASLANEPILILAALVTVYIVLGVLYESYVHPITILSTLPSAGVGALIALLLCHMDLSVIALIGIILLIGIVKKNAIMMIDFALEAQRNQGMTPREAIYEACLLRFRPIMMTTMAALLGAVPLAMGTGVGSELRQPLGITIIGGLLFSQVLTLYTTPVIYLAFDRLASLFARTRARSLGLVSGGTDMNFSKVFIHRPVGTTLLTIAITLAGAIGYFLLPVSPLPQVDFPTIQVSAALPGASPETMASAVATPLERQFGRIAGITEMTSTSTLGNTQVVMQFDLNRNIDAAARDVQAAINAARGRLPPNLPNNPTYRKVNPADAPIMILALTSDTYTRDRMYDAAATILQQKLSQVRGVGQVYVGGGSAPAVRVDINPTALNHLGLGLDDVRTALASANANRPKGQISAEGQSWSLATTDQLLQASEYQPLIVSFRNGAPVRLSDVASVTDSVEDLRTSGLYDGKPSIMVIVFRQPGANIIATVDRVHALLPLLQAQIPADMKLSVALDRTATIRASLHDVQVTLIISILLVLAVVFVFLRNLRATIIPSVAVPVSLVSTFGVMYLAGYSLDNLSLMALTIATGFVVDDAIVVIENITRHLEQGASPLEAALQGAKEIAFTVLSISVSLVAVFIPILLMGGIVGRLFREFAVTISVAIAVSMVVSLTTTPMMCALLLKSHADERPGRLYRASERLFDWIIGLYESSLAVVLRHQRITLAVMLATVGFTIYLYVVVPKGFFPQQDTGRLVGAIQADQGASFQSVRKLLVRFADVVSSDPDVDEGLIAFTGGSNGGAANTARMFVNLKPRDVREASADQVIARLRGKISKIPGATMVLQSVQDLRVGGRSSSAQYQFTLRSDSLDDLTAWGPKVLRAMRQLPLIADVTSDQQNRGLQVALTIDRDAASRLGITTQMIDDALYDAFGQRQVSTMYKPLNQYRVVMGLQSSFWQNPDALKHIYLRGPNDSQIPLSAVCSYKPSNTPLAVNHSGQFPSVTISFNLAPGVALGEAVDEIEEMKGTLGLPESIQGSFSGTAQAFRDSLANEPLLVLAALVAVYIVLGVLYESYIHPITILSTLPSAGVGALLALQLCRMDLNVMAMIGIILLIGIVKKNAIMMIDFALDAERRLGLSPEEAIFQACVLRFRPITMTTLAALLGGLPLALGTGNGAELRQPLGIAVVGGLIFSQMLTLYTTPVVYLYLDHLRLWFNRRRSAGGQEHLEAEHALA